jgi:hypothetical protein
MQLVICSISGEMFLKNFVQLSKSNVCSNLFPCSVFKMNKFQCLFTL